MRLFKVTYNLSLFGDKKLAIKGQAMVEFIIIIPLLLAFMVVGYDFGNVAYTQHKITQAAYEAVKVASQVSGNFVLKCAPGGSVPCLSEAMESRAKRVLEEAGIKVDPANPKFVVKFIEDDNTTPRDTPQGKMKDRLIGMNIQIPYSIFGGAVFGAKEHLLSAEVKTFYDQVPFVEPKK